MHLVDLESCCLFNNACLFLVSVQAELQRQRVLWVNTNAQEEDKLGAPPQPPKISAFRPRGASAPRGKFPAAR